MDGRWLRMLAAGLLAGVVATAARAEALIDESFRLEQLDAEAAAAAPLELAALPQAPAYGPAPSPEAAADDDVERFDSVGEQIGVVKWELIGLAAYFTAINGGKLVKEGGRSFRFQDEGFFGKETFNLGMDKLAHAFNSYAVADILTRRIDHKTGHRAPNSAVTGALLASGLMIYAEVFDGFKDTSGFSVQDVVMNTGGAAIAVLRNKVPGLRQKLDFRQLIQPNSDGYTFTGQKHYEQQRYLLAFRPSGFERLRRSPLRFVEFHVGYHATGFTPEQRARGERLRRLPFVGIGLDVKQLFFPNPRSGVSRMAEQALDYIQLPYTSTHFH